MLPAFVPVAGPVPPSATPVLGESVVTSRLRGSQGLSVQDVPGETGPHATSLLAAGAMVGTAVGAASRKSRRAKRSMASKIACRADFLNVRERIDGHGWLKVDPVFDPKDSSCYGQVVTVEMKKRPMGVIRYTHANGFGAMVAEMHEVSRYPGDPRGQAAVAGVKKNYLVKSINGTEVLTWDFRDIMDFLEDAEANVNTTQESAAKWASRKRNHQAVQLPAQIEFIEYTVKEQDAGPVSANLEGKWYPRPGGFSDAELDAELARVRAESPVPAGYTGVQYTGAACLNEAWIMAFMEQQKSGILLPKAQAYHLVIDVIKLQQKEKTMTEITVPPGSKITVCGDTHGQYWDTTCIFEKNGIPSPTNPYIFNGDFVDRGSWGIENVMLLYAMKVKDPAHMFFTRGNHELIEANLIYGFCGECTYKYDANLFDLFSESFRLLSLNHLVNKQVYVCHAGVPGPNPRLWLPGQSHDPEDAIPVNSETYTIERLAKIDRYTELQDASYKDSVAETAEQFRQNVNEDTALIIDMLWADPRGGAGYGPSYRKSRGVFMFGPDITEKFCVDNNLSFCVRSHEVKDKGCRQDHPRLWTVFSAANYLDTGGNDGGYLHLVNENGTIKPVPNSFPKNWHPPLPPMVYQEYMMLKNPHLTKQMKKVSGVKFDSEGNVISQLDMDQGDDDTMQSGFSDSWVEDDSYVATEDLSDDQVNKAFQVILQNASVKSAA